jgi:hypothetical protein
MKTLVKLLLILSLSPIIGCGNKTVPTQSEPIAPVQSKSVAPVQSKSVAPAEPQLFQDASLKADWDTALAALHTNGYLAAAVSLKKLQSKNLTLKQVAAVQDVRRALDNQMCAALIKGDSRASNALAEIQKLPQ